VRRHELFWVEKMNPGCQNSPDMHIKNEGCK